MRVGVIGAALGGLGTAVVLQRAGADVTVLERSAQPRATGVGISLFGDGLTVLDALVRPAEGLARDTALRLLPAAVLARQLAAVQAWQPPPSSPRTAPPVHHSSEETS